MLAEKLEITFYGIIYYLLSRQYLSKVASTVFKLRLNSSGFENSFEENIEIKKIHKI